MLSFLISKCPVHISVAKNKRKIAGNHAKFRQKGNIPVCNFKLYPTSEDALKRKGDVMR